MRRFRGAIAAACVALVCGLGLLAGPPTGKPDGFTLAILHMNDTYEITPLNRGTVGGLARVATLKKQLAKKYPGRLLTVHAGDFLSPSALGTAVISGKRVAGQQMVEVLKAVGIDYIIFGNHEFDLDQTTFRKRLDELIKLRDLPDLGQALDRATVKQANDRRRALFSTNVSQLNQKPFDNVPRDRIWVPSDNEGKGLARIGFVGLTIETLKSAPKDQYAVFEAPLKAAQAQIEAWQKSGEKLNAVVALTHQSLDDDEKLARAEPRINLILGGHEHVNAHRRAVPARADNPPIAPIYRADANVRTVYLHQLHFENGQLTRIESTLMPVTDAIPEDPVVAAVVQEWADKAFRSFQAAGLGDPEEELTTLTETYDGREESVRTRATNLTDLIGDAMLAPLKGTPANARLAIFNGGSIRIDDELQPGPITTYDVLRILPFGGMVYAVEVPGDLLAGMLDHTISSKGQDPGQNSGAFIQTRNVTRADGVWKIGGTALDPKKTYTVVSNDYLIRGGRGTREHQASGVQGPNRDAGEGEAAEVR